MTLQQPRLLDQDWKDALNSLCLINDESEFKEGLRRIVIALTQDDSFNESQCTFDWHLFKMLRFHFTIATQIAYPDLDISQHYQQRIKRILELMAVFIASGYTVCECQDVYVLPPQVFLAEVFVSCDFPRLCDFFVKAQVNIAHYSNLLPDLDRPDRARRLKVLKEKQKAAFPSLLFLASSAVRRNLRTNTFAATQIFLDQKEITTPVADAITLDMRSSFL